MNKLIERILKKSYISNKKCFLYENQSADNILIQAIDKYDLEVLDNEVAKIKELSNEKFTLIAFLVDNWNDDLSPWEAPAVFGEESFGGKAYKTLEYIEKDLIPYLKEKYGDNNRIYIGGYSLSALFALWTCYNTSIFDGVVAASPSMWFPNFIEYAKNNQLKAEKVYLSLGDKEEKTRNKIMSTVGNNIREFYAMLKQNMGNNVVFEWNEGNHFINTDLRTAKGFAWIMKNNL